MALICPQKANENEQKYSAQLLANSLHSENQIFHLIPIITTTFHLVSELNPAAMAETREFKRMEEALRSLLKEHIEKQDNWVNMFTETLKKQQETLEKQTTSIEELKQQLDTSKKSNVIPMGSSGSSHSAVKNVWQNPMRSVEGNSQEGNQLPTRNARVEFPRFSGEGFKSWRSKAEQFFLVDETPDDLKVKIAVMYLDEKPYECFDSYSRIRDPT